MQSNSNGQSGSSNNNSTSSQRRSPRPQFHYFYGSVGDSSTQSQLNNNNAAIVDDDKDSLVGESLVSTDNESIGGGGGGSTSNNQANDGKYMLDGNEKNNHTDDNDTIDEERAGKNEYDRLLRSTTATASNGHHHHHLYDDEDDKDSSSSSTCCHRRRRSSSSSSSPENNRSSCCGCCRVTSSSSSSSSSPVLSWLVAVGFIVIVGSVAVIGLLIIARPNSFANVMSTLSTQSSSSSSSSSSSTSLASRLSSSSSSSSSGSSTIFTSSNFPTPSFTIPYPSVDRGDYGDPVHDFIDTSLFHPNLLSINDNDNDNSNNNNSTGTTTTTTGSPTFQFPFPTGAFWTNLVVKPPGGSSNNGNGGPPSYPIAVYPYAYRWSSSSMQISYPASHRVITDDARTIANTFAPDLTLTTQEHVAKRHVVAFDPFSVTVRYVTDASDSKWESSLVQGSPYITIQYLRQTPIITPLSIYSSVSCPGDADENFADMMDDPSSTRTTSTTTTSSSSTTTGGFQTRTRNRRNLHTTTATATTTTPSPTNVTTDTMDNVSSSSSTSTAFSSARQKKQMRRNRRKLFGVCSIDDTSDSQVTTMRGVQFIFKTPEGSSWIMFTSEPMNLIFDKIRKTTITSAAPFTGIIRIAYIPTDRSLGDTSSMSSSMVSSSSTDGGSSPKTFGSSTGLRRLIYHADVYPVGGQLSYQFSSTTASPSSSTTSTTQPSLSTIDQSSRKATVSFNFATRSMMGSSYTTSSTTPTTNLLMLALPHHDQLMSHSSSSTSSSSSSSSSLTAAKLSHKKFDLTYQCIKGNMTAFVGSSWTFDEPLYDVEFDGPAQPVDDSVRQLILDQISDDLDRVLPTYSENVYGYGKQVARIAQLAHIANQLTQQQQATSSSNMEAGDTSTTNSTSSSSSTTTDGGDQDSSVDDVPSKANKLLAKYLESFLSSKVSDALLFDANMGGLVSNDGLHDKGEDFGNGRYNDHHFHYSYFLYASAVMARLDPTFLDRFGSHVDTLFHDIAHTSNGDSRSVGSGQLFFPFTRHKSWFDGHSFATGMFAFGDGKSQESSSEAVNAYYGAYLWSLVRHGDDYSEVTDFARLLLATEIRGAKTYWHMLPSDPTAGNSTSSSSSPTTQNSWPHVYPPNFEQHYMVGNVGMLDVAVNTWFGNDPLYVHMIQAIPVTSALRLLFDESYVEQEYPYLMKTQSSVEMAWRGYTTCIHAIIDPNQAWDDAQGLVSYELDAALSKSQVLYFISQLPGFTAPSSQASSSTNPTNSHISSGGSSSSSPDTDSSTSKTGTSSSSSTPSTSNQSTIGTSSSSSSCEENASCVSQGLTGQCCPTSQNVFLDCCN